MDNMNGCVNYHKVHMGWDLYTTTNYTLTGFI